MLSIARPARQRRTTRFMTAASALVLGASLLAAQPATAAPVPGIDVLYTTDAHFDSGVLQDVNHDAPNNNQLQLDRVQTFFPYVNIAASQRGTMVRIDVNTGEIIGEWYSAPTGRAAIRPGRRWTGSATPGCPTATKAAAARVR